jgi:hypothetical protein
MAVCQMGRGRPTTHKWGRGRFRPVTTNKLLKKSRLAAQTARELEKSPENS